MRPANRSHHQGTVVRSDAMPVLFMIAVLGATAWPGHGGAGRDRGAPPGSGSERVRVNDNRAPAGLLRGSQLTLRLDAVLAMWHPDGDSAPGAFMPAFAEEGKAPQIPGPLIRVPAGTDVLVRVRNSLPSDSVVVHGLHSRLLASRPTPAPAPARLAPGEVQTLRFRLGVPGTYYYWGTTMGRSIDLRTREDAQLSGAIVVDEPGRRAQRDRILVLGTWSDTVARALTHRPRMLGVINGRPWPHTERFQYAVGDTVRWRVINASADRHPMHLHGFYFRVESRGDGVSDSFYPDSARDLVVTENMPGGTTMSMAWVAERAGNWIFHCHIPEHFAPRGPLGMTRPQGTAPAHGSTVDHAVAGMGGLVVGIRVRPTGRQGSTTTSTVNAPRRHLRLLVRSNAGGTGSLPLFGFALQEGVVEPAPDSGYHVGPPIILTRGETVSITVVNHTPEATAVHWHGIELESYFDGVAGFSGSGSRLAPMIAPNDSFEVRFTPPRAGTFIYHTHVDEQRQQLAGLAGALLVLHPGQRYDPSTDKTVLLTSPRDSASQARSVLLNGSVSPPPLDLREGVSYRFRFINMTLTRTGSRMEMRQDSLLTHWRPLAKDGADLPGGPGAPRPARQTIGIGETVDVEWMPTSAGAFRLEAWAGRSTELGMGGLLGAIPVRVRGR